jgi:hypothetical protein
MIGGVSRRSPPRSEAPPDRANWLDAVKRKDEKSVQVLLDKHGFYVPTKG